MGKRRLNCPGCGKAIAVSKTAKKARCPGCKEVIDVAAALGGSAEAPADAAAAAQNESAGAASEPASAPAAEGAPADQQTDGAEAGGAVAAAEEREPAAKPAPRASRAAESDGEPFPEEEFKAPDRPPVTMVGPLKAWLAVVIGCAVSLVILLIFVEWYVAIVVVCGMGMYVDSSLARITRVFPGSRGYGHAPMVWGLLGFIPLIGIVLYVLLRPKLVANSPEDIATPGMSLIEMEDQAKILAPRLIAPGLLLLIPLVVIAALMFRREPSLELVSGTLTQVGRRIQFVPSDRDEPWFNQGKVGFRLRAKSALEEYGKLSYVVVEVTAGGDAITQTAGQIDTVAGKNRNHWDITAKKAGTFRMEIKDEEGDVIATTSYRIRRQ